MNNVHRCRAECALLSSKLTNLWLVPIKINCISFISRGPPTSSQSTLWLVASASVFNDSGCNFISWPPYTYKFNIFWKSRISFIEMNDLKKFFLHGFLKKLEALKYFVKHDYLKWQRPFLIIIFVFNHWFTAQNGKIWKGTTQVNWGGSDFSRNQSFICQDL